MESERIKELRKKTGLSQEKFCARYNIPKRTLQEWEAGHRVPPIYVVELLERVVTEDFKEE